MHRNLLLPWLHVILCFFLGSSVARETIVGGTTLNLGIPQYFLRYQATILLSDHEPRCGGGIIDSRAILTAAHCVIANGGGTIARPIYVLVGTYNLASPGIVHEAEKIYVPESYHAQNADAVADVAVIMLKHNFNMTRHNLNMVRLGTPRGIAYYVNKAAIIAGFGWDRMFDMNSIIGEHSDNHLRFLEVHVRSVVECQHDHPARNLSFHLCARARVYPRITRGVCVGDDGGPLVHGGDILIGVLSVPTATCNETESSGIYTSVAHYHDFINYAKNDVEHETARVIYV